MRVLVEWNITSNPTIRHSLAERKWASLSSCPHPPSLPWFQWSPSVSPAPPSLPVLPPGHPAATPDASAHTLSTNNKTHPVVNCIYVVSQLVFIMWQSHCEQRPFLSVMCQLTVDSCPGEKKMDIMKRLCDSQHTTNTENVRCPCSQLQYQTFLSTQFYSCLFCNEHVGPECVTWPALSTFATLATLMCCTEVIS